MAPLYTLFHIICGSSPDVAELKRPYQALYSTQDSEMIKLKCFNFFLVHVMGCCLFTSLCMWWVITSNAREPVLIDVTSFSGFPLQGDEVCGNKSTCMVAKNTLIATGTHTTLLSPCRGEPGNEAHLLQWCECSVPPASCLAIPHLLFFGLC